jgi:hypothetical protein
MLLTSDDTDPAQVSLACRWENEQRNLRFIAFNGVSLLKGARLPVRSRNAAQRLLLTNGRTRTFSRTRASSSHDSWPRRRRGRLSPAFGTAHISSARLLQKPLCTNRAWSDGRRGSAARGLDRRPYASSYIRSVATLHALDPCDRTLQISGLSTADEVFVQGHPDGERARPDGNQRSRGSRERTRLGAAYVEDFVQGERGDPVRETGRTER